MKLATGNWKLVAGLSVLSGLSVLGGPLGIERMEEIEAQDTVLDDGEVVAIKTTSDPATVQLRYGDGETAGGIIVADPYSIKAAYHRPLARSEYSIILSGRAVVTNGVYRLLTVGPANAYDAANVGGMTIRPRNTAAKLSAISYLQSDYGASFAETEYPAFARGATNITLAAAQMKSSPIDGGTVRCIVSNLTVYGWEGTHLIGKTNDCRGTMLLVADAAEDDEALNLGTHNRLLANHRGENWSLYAATQAVDMAWQNVWLSPYCRLTGTANGADLAITKPSGALATNAVSIHYAGQACTIVGYQLSATNVTFWVESSITMTNAPAVQACTNLTVGTWNTRTATSTWPATSWHQAGSGKRFPVWTMTTARTAPSEFFRIVGYPSAANNHVTINLPLRPAAGITLGGVTVTSWAELKAVLEALP
jgi:hypothetical protein